MPTSEKLFLLSLKNAAIISLMNTKSSNGFLPVFAALTGNVFIMVIKWIGFFMTGSGALFSEAIHSVADVFNQILLLVGIHRSQKPSDKGYHYGYGNERFFLGADKCL